MTDPQKLVALGHAWDLAVASARRREELFALKAVMIDKNTKDEKALAERTAEMSPGKSPFEQMAAMFEEVLGNYGYAIVATGGESS